MAEMQDRRSYVSRRDGLPMWWSTRLKAVRWTAPFFAGLCILLELFEAISFLCSVPFWVGCVRKNPPRAIDHLLHLLLIHIYATSQKDVCGLRSVAGREEVIDFELFMLWSFFYDFRIDTKMFF